MALGVVFHHQRQAQVVAAFSGERRHDHTGRVAHDEGDLLGRGELRRHDEVALVLAILVVDHDHDLAAADGRHDVLDRGEGKFAAHACSLVVGEWLV